MTRGNEQEGLDFGDNLKEMRRWYADDKTVK